MPTLSPGSWLALLERRLDMRRPAVQRYMNYRDGRHPLAFATTKFRQAFGNLFGEFADNWCGLVVDAPAERLHIEGFRFGEPGADSDAWRIWQANGLDAGSGLIHREAIACMEAYTLVEPGRTPDDVPRITVEHPSQFIVATSPADPRVRLAGLKKWLDDDGYLYATLYLPEAVFKYRSQRKAGSYAGRQRVDWGPRPGVQPLAENPLGVVPGIPFRNAPTMLGGGTSDLDPAIPIQDAANKIVLDMMVAAEFAAYPQRLLAGVELPTDSNGDPLPDVDVKGAVSRLLMFENSEVKWGQFDVADLGNYVKAVEMLVQHLAAQTRTPPHYLLGQSGAFPSGESLKATETGLVARVEDKQRHFGEAWEETLRVAFRAMGDNARAAMIDAETLWRDPESRTTGEQVDAAVKEQSLGVPQEAIWSRRLGATPQEIDRWKQMQTEQAIRTGSFMFSGNPSDNGANADTLP